MIKYDSYKDSGIEWLGKVPVHWSEKRLKELATIFGGKDYKHIVSDDGLYDVIGSGGSFEKATEYLYNKESVLLGRKGTIDKPLYVNRAFWAVDTMYFTKIPNYTHGRYFFYLCTTIEFGYYKYGSALPSMTQGDLNRILFFTPALNEQTAIAQYLDTKTQAIDKKVNLLEKKIGYYKELRKSIINETVTKGLDKTIKFQENDLGFQTPSSWSKKRLKDVGFLYSGLSGKSGDDFNQDDNPNNKGFIPFTNIANNTYLKKDHLGTVVVFDGEKQNKVKEGDIFFLMSSEGYDDIGKSAVLAENIEDTYLNSFCKGFRIKQKDCNPYFLNYLLLSDYYRQILIIEGKGFTRINLKMEKVNDFEVYLPINLNEQSDIVTYLDHKTQTIDKIVGNIQKQISTIKELRKTLINDVVTGKIKVVE